MWGHRCRLWIVGVIYTGALASLKESDSELYGYIKKELKRQRETIELIPSENFASPAVIGALGTVLTNKYSEGYPGRRYYAGNAHEDRGGHRIPGKVRAPTAPR